MSGVIAFDLVASPPFDLGPTDGWLIVTAARGGRPRSAGVAAFPHGSSGRPRGAARFSRRWKRGTQAILLGPARDVVGCAPRRPQRARPGRRRAGSDSAQRRAGGGVTGAMVEAGEGGAGTLEHEKQLGQGCLVVPRRTAQRPRHPTTAAAAATPRGPRRSRLTEDDPARAWPLPTAEGDSSAEGASRLPIPSASLLLLLSAL